MANVMGVSNEGIAPGEGQLRLGHAPEVATC